MKAIGRILLYVMLIIISPIIGIIIGIDVIRDLYDNKDEN
jgi:hypothetical protein